MKLRDVAEPLHTVLSRRASTDAPDMATFYNSGIDAVVDAVDGLGYVLIPRELVTALRDDLGDLERAFTAYADGNQLFLDTAPFRQQHWPAVRELLSMED